MALKEKCGIFGIFGNLNNPTDASRLVYYGLFTLQHRGQESSGIATSNGRKISCYKDQGLVSHVYDEENLAKLKGHIAIGHNRYATFGRPDEDHAQPVFYGQNTLALAHNGNLPVVAKLRKFLKA